MQVCENLLLKFGSGAAEERKLKKHLPTVQHKILAKSLAGGHRLETDIEENMTPQAPNLLYFGPVIMKFTQLHS